jgi:hypothetical protein
MLYIHLGSYTVNGWTGVSDSAEIPSILDAYNSDTIQCFFILNKLHKKCILWQRSNKIIKNLSANWLLQIDVTLYTWFTFHYCSDFFEMHTVHYGKSLPNFWSWCTYRPCNILKSDAHLHDT